MANVTAAMKGNSDAQAIFAAVQAHADGILPLPPVARPPASFSGILDAAREVLDRLYSLVTVARITGSQVYADRAVTEMLNCTAWSDWNPEAHFLDTAELMHGVGAAYDAIYSTISPANRTRIAQGLATNGLAAYAEYHSSAWWWKTVFNWGGVCNGGAIVGALALLDDPVHSALAQQVLDDALAGIPSSVAGYAPSGMWPEGPIYEDYMTRYVIAAITALDGAGYEANASALASAPGFSDTCEFTILEQGAGTQQFFDWSDSDADARPHPNLMWLASRFGKPACAAFGRFQSGVNGTDSSEPKSTRLGTSVNAVARNLLYFDASGSMDDVAALDLDRVYNSTTTSGFATGAATGMPLVALFHKSLNFSNLEHGMSHMLAFKGGINGINHGHLDAGSFVYDFSAIRFAEDLGSGSYALPDYFGPKRWDYYRTNSTGHNVLRVGTRNQNVPAASAITSFAINDDALAHAGPWAVADLSAAYESSGMSMAQRGVALLNEREQALVVDNLQAATGTPLDQLVWQMHTQVENVTGPFVDKASGDSFFSLRYIMASDGRVIQTYLRLLGASTSCPGIQAAPPYTPTVVAPQRPLEGTLKLEFRAPDASKCTAIAVTLGPALPSAAFTVNTALDTWRTNGPLQG